MPLLVNPGGRIVVVDDPRDYEYWLNQTGFRKATAEEERGYLAERVAKAREKDLNKTRGLGVYFATVSSGGKDGYGRAADLITRELKKMDVPVTRYYNDQKVAIVFHAPYSIARVEAPYKILYTMFESSRIPEDWEPYLKEADKILVPSKWCQKVFKNSGIDTEVVPLGYDEILFKYHERINKRQARKDFVFLHYNAFNIRKGFPEVFKAFTKEFKKDEPVRLVLKTTLNHPPLPITKTQYPNIDVICGKSSEAELLDIIHKSDCFVFPSRGEGFGMTPLEAMATGIPAIVPNAHGISEYFNPAYMYEVEIAEKCPGIYSRYKGVDVGEMVVCSVDNLRRKMRYAYEHQEEVLGRGKAASEYVKSWTIKKTAEQIKRIYEEALATPVRDRKLTDVLTLEKVM